MIRNNQNKIGNKNTSVGWVCKSSQQKKLEKVEKSVWGMPRLSEAMKDVISCDKLRGLANMN